MSETDNLLHPELLSSQQLRDIIRERHLKLPSLEEMLREDLLEIFHQYCVPYAQRRYRDSGRGKILNQSRSSMDNSPSKAHTTLNKIETMDWREATKKLCKDRLQPPPDVLSNEIKKIKLSNGVQKTNNLSLELSLKRKVEYNNTPMQTNGVPPEKKVRKQITWP